MIDSVCRRVKIERGRKQHTVAGDGGRPEKPCLREMGSESCFREAFCSLSPAAFRLGKRITVSGRMYNAFFDNNCCGSKAHSFEGAAMLPREST